MGRGLVGEEFGNHEIAILYGIIFLFTITHFLHKLNSNKFGKFCLI